MNDTPEATTKGLFSRELIIPYPYRTMNPSRVLASGLRARAACHCKSVRSLPTIKASCVHYSYSAPLSTSASSGDISKEWRDIFQFRDIDPKIIHENPWDLAVSSLAPLSYPAVDTTSRHVIQLLQELYLSGRPRSADRITTQRCNAALKRLVQVQGGAERAHDILETMKIFSSYNENESLRYPQQRQRRPQQEGRQPIELPLPDRDTYRHVLHAESRGGNPLRAHAMVQELERLYTEEGQLEFKPHVFHWNCVLLAWKESSNWERSVHAAKLLFELHAKDRELLNATSYITLLRICGHGHENEKAAILGANVAIKLWKVVMEEDPHEEEIRELPSHFYSAFLQTIRSIPTENPTRPQYFGKCFERACREGKVNEIVMNEFLVHCRSESVSKKYLGNYMKAIYAMSTKKAVTVLMEKVPSSWTERADQIRKNKNAPTG